MKMFSKQLTTPTVTLSGPPRCCFHEKIFSYRLKAPAVMTTGQWEVRNYSYVLFCPLVYFEKLFSLCVCGTWRSSWWFKSISYWEELCPCAVLDSDRSSALYTSPSSLWTFHLIASEYISYTSVAFRDSRIQTCLFISLRTQPEGDRGKLILPSIPHFSEFISEQSVLLISSDPILFILQVICIFTL